MRIAELLLPFGVSSLNPAQLRSISTYVDVLLKWNARINLTAVRRAEEVVTRHFGESLFTARQLFPDGENSQVASVADVGSGAGFPGLPMKLWAPPVGLTLIESNQKKATFLKEVARSLTLMNVNIVTARAEQVVLGADVVTLRAVEKFETVLPTATRLVASHGRIALLIGEGQVAVAQRAPGFVWTSPERIPLSKGRVLLVGQRQ